MKVVKNTDKTVRIEMEAGERFDVKNGYSIDSMVLRWNGNDKLKERLVSAINDIKTYKDTDVEYMLCIEAEERKERIIQTL